MTTRPWHDCLNEAIDEANRRDARGRAGSDDTGESRATIDARRVVDWVGRIAAQRGEVADPVQMIAARAHHLYRWELPRGDAGPGRANYLRWRRAVAEHQGRRLRELCDRCRVPEATTRELCALVAKDPNASPTWGRDHEDALCLAFLEGDLADLLDRLPLDTAQRALRRTWLKMSPTGRVLADDLLASQPELRDMLRDAATPDR